MQLFSFYFKKSENLQKIIFLTFQRNNRGKGSFCSENFWGCQNRREKYDRICIRSRYYQSLTGKWSLSYSIKTYNIWNWCHISLQIYTRLLKGEIWHQHSALKEILLHLIKILYTRFFNLFETHLVHRLAIFWVIFLN